MWEGKTGVQQLLSGLEKERELGADREKKRPYMREKEGGKKGPSTLSRERREIRKKAHMRFCWARKNLHWNASRKSSVLRYFFSFLQKRKKEGAAYLPLEKTAPQGIVVVQKAEGKRTLFAP